MTSLPQKPLMWAVGITFVILGGIYILFGRGPSAPQDQSVVQSHRSYELIVTSNTNNVAPGQSAKISYQIKNDQGAILKNFATVHEKIMHLIVVRKDLQEFQHLHPDYNQATGEFSVHITFPSDGPYLIFPDFTPAKSADNPQLLPVTLSHDIVLGTVADYKPQPVGTTEKSKTFDGYQVVLTPQSLTVTSGNSVSFDFDIKKDGELVTNLEKYLDALGHTVVLREGDLQFIHAHATQKLTNTQTGKVNFEITFPQAGNYKLFSQFQHEGKIITSDFVVNVLQGKEDGSGSAPMHQIPKH